ncbi:MAG TPA: hypothetical protein VN029_04245, partial [Sphingomonas sp.]|nr:hypothetical protein [Sphingomonas sp.]
GPPTLLWNLYAGGDLPRGTLTGLRPTSPPATNMRELIVKAFLRRLEQGAGGWPAQLGLRLGGAMLLGLCALAVWALAVSINRPPMHSADPAEFGEAVFSVIAWALGWALLIEGPDLFRLIPVPPRHARFDRHQ